MPNITLTITMDDSGSINVEGPIDNKFVSYAMLAIAKEVISDHNRRKSERLVQPATMLLPKQ